MSLMQSFLGNGAKSIRSDWVRDNLTNPVRLSFYRYVNKYKYLELDYY